MEKKAAFKKLRKIFLLTVIFFTQVLYSFPEDWTLAASKFTFTDSEAKNSSQKASASLIPQLVLEQIAENSSRLTTREEMLDRSLNTLLTERLSLFLQLSKEVKTRDSLFFIYVLIHLKITLYYFLYELVFTLFYIKLFFFLVVYNHCVVLVLHLLLHLFQVQLFEVL